MTDPDVEIEVGASAQELRIRRKGEVIVNLLGDAEPVSERERRNLPAQARDNRLYRRVRLRSRNGAELNRRDGG